MLCCGVGRLGVTLCSSAAFDFSLWPIYYLQVTASSGSRNLGKKTQYNRFTLINNISDNNLSN